MNRKIRRIRVDIEIDGRAVAAADVEQHDEPGVVRAALHVEPGVPPPGSRARLVDTILNLPEVHTQRRLEATLPIGETEILQRLRERCDSVQTRPAGATCLVDADLPGGRRPVWSPSRPPAAPLTSTRTRGT
jgi:hypothetical protein